MTGSTISDHFVLETYTSSHRGKETKKHGPGIFAASSKKPNTADGYVTVAAQADGIHIIDVSVESNRKEFANIGSGIYFAPGDISYVGSFDIVCLPTDNIAVVFESSIINICYFIHLSGVNI